MQATDSQLSIIAVYIYCVKKYHVHFRISYTMKAEDIFRSSISCEIMLMIKTRIRLIFSRYNSSITDDLVEPGETFVCIVCMQYKFHAIPSSGYLALAEDRKNQ